MSINTIIIAAAYFISGLIAGTFLNVIIHKIPRKISLFNPYSTCSNCRQKVPLIYNFPIIAYAAGKYRCRHCNLKIPVQNILVEILTALLYVLIYVTFGNTLTTAIGIILISTAIPVSLIDWEFMIIPNIIILPSAVVGLALTIAKNLQKWWMPLVFSFGAFLFMLIVHLIYPKGMGMGDVKLSFMLGAFLVRNVVAGLFIGFLLGSIAGLIFLIFKKKTLKQFIPFGPFLCAGGVVSFFIGNALTGWYLGFF